MTRLAPPSPKKNRVERLRSFGALATVIGALATLGLDADEPILVTPAREGETADARDLLARGTKLARDDQIREALEAWVKAYVRLLPEYRRLPFRHTVRADFMGREELEKFLVAEIRSEYPPEELARDSAVFARFGFFDAHLDLEKILLGMLTQEIAGFYDPNTKALYLIGEEPKGDEDRNLWDRIFGGSKNFSPDEQRLILSHELSHALADQHFDLFSLMHAARDDDDATLAVTSLVEGEATAVMTVDAAVAGGQTLESALVALDTMAKVMANLSPLATLFGTGPAFRSAPPILRETLIFPYTGGLGFVAALVRDGSWGPVNVAFGKPPISTEQILHPEKYFHRDDDPPLALTFPEKSPFSSESWELYDANVLGELQIEILLRPVLGKPESTKAAEGWGGDRYQAYRRRAEGAGTIPIVWGTVWDRAEDAHEFFDALVELSRAEHGLAEDVPATLDEENDRGAVDWTTPEGKSAIVWRGRDVRWLSDIPADLFEEVSSWSEKVESAPKEISIAKREPKVRFEDAARERAEDVDPEDDD